MKMKNLNYLILVVFTMLFLIISCSKTNDVEPNKILEKSFQKEKFSEFAIEVNGSPVPIPEIAKGVYTKPRSNYGMSPYIDFVVNTDNTIDVLWLDG